MKRKILCWMFSIICVLQLNITAHASAPSLNVNAKSAILMEPFTGQVLLEQNAHDRLAPASVTKIMTILLIYEAVEDEKIQWEDIVSVSEHATSMGGSQIFLEPYEKQTVRDLTKSIVIASANDAAVAMAEYIAGSEEGFVLMMNNKAKGLGMFDTNFENACGLDSDNHYTSAYDIAVMTRELITRYPEVFDLSTVWMDTIVHKTARGEEVFGLTNTNKLIKSYSGATGLKTGSTSKALYCLSATAKRGNISFIAVVMAAPDPKTRFAECSKMFDYGFANYALADGNPEGTVIGSVKIDKGEKLDSEVIVKTQVHTLISKSKTAKLTSKYAIVDSLTAPVRRGTKAGEIVYYFEDKPVGRSELIVSESIDKAGLDTVIKRLWENWLKY